MIFRLEVFTIPLGRSGLKVTLGLRSSDFGRAKVVAVNGRSRPVDGVDGERLGVGVAHELFIATHQNKRNIFLSPYETVSQLREPTKESCAKFFLPLLV